MKQIFEKKKQNLRGSITYGSGSRKKNRGSGNRGGVGKAGIWGHKKSSKKKYEEIAKEAKIIARKKARRKEEVTFGFLNSNKYIKRLEKRNIFVDQELKIIENKGIPLSGRNKKYLEAKGYIIK
jgi:ribosomal protein L15